MAITKKGIVQSLRVGVLLAGEPTSHQYKKYFIHENRSIAMKQTVKNTAADYGRYGEKYQNSQPSTDIHRCRSPIILIYKHLKVIAYVVIACNNIR